MRTGTFHPFLQLYFSARNFGVDSGYLKKTGKGKGSFPPIWGSGGCVPVAFSRVLFFSTHKDANAKRRRFPFREREREQQRSSGGFVSAEFMSPFFRGFLHEFPSVPCLSIDSAPRFPHCVRIERASSKGWLCCGRLKRAVQAVVLEVCSRLLIGATPALPWWESFLPFSFLCWAVFAEK